MRKYSITTKNNEVVNLALVQSTIDNKYRYVTYPEVMIVTKDFETIEQAVDYMEDKLQQGEIFNFERIDDQEESEPVEIMEEAKIALKRHKEFVEDWQEGNIVEAWRDKKGNLCVQYESGRWWHYKDLDLPFPTWW
ncbi:MAG: hypothetical protein SPJ08_03765 [Sphaerochaetaceae bacterium]|nr:hypothetical protein [Sphaerochaetaceae bacterium]